MFIERRSSFGITVNAARYSSEDAVILVEYVLAVLEYTKQYKPYKKIRDYIESLTAEQDEHESAVEDDKKESEQDLVDEKVLRLILCIVLLIARFTIDPSNYKGHLYLRFYTL